MGCSAACPEHWAREHKRQGSADQRQKREGRVVTSEKDVSGRGCGCKQGLDDVDRQIGREAGVNEGAAGLLGVYECEEERAQ